MPRKGKDLMLQKLRYAKLDFSDQHFQSAELHSSIGVMEVGDSEPAQERPKLPIFPQQFVTETHMAKSSMSIQLRKGKAKTRDGPRKYQTSCYRTMMRSRGAPVFGEDPDDKVCDFVDHCVSMPAA
ncbi:hypothetical protein DPEC_G00363760 [Dallia pectoralis]|nr:hypothetical protein DPEC_G00363760 [Dallia pectoralis]